MFFGRLKGSPFQDTYLSREKKSELYVRSKIFIDVIKVSEGFFHLFSIVICELHFWSFRHFVLNLFGKEN